MKFLKDIEKHGKLQIISLKNLKNQIPNHTFKQKEEENRNYPIYMKIFWKKYPKNLKTNI